MKAKKRAVYTEIFPFEKEKKCSKKRYLHEGKITEGNNGEKLRHLMP